MKVLSGYDRPFTANIAQKKVKKSGLSKLLARLESKGLLARRERGLYVFPDRIFREYVFRKAKYRK